MSARRDWLFQDWETNAPAMKPRVLLVFFRLAQRPPRGLAKPIRLAYRLFSDWMLGIELHWQTPTGPRLRIDHGHGLVVHPDAVLGSDVRLRHGITVGNDRVGGGVPRIGDGVDFGAGVVVLGDIDVGAGAILGANAVVLKDVPPGATMVGIPARALERAPK
jgi:serine acetyltransferase